MAIPKKADILLLVFLGSLWLEWVFYPPDYFSLNLDQLDTPSELLTASNNMCL